MPFSDDLYSPDANYYSDAESFNDELSPADGYFQRDNPSNAIVPDPSQPSADKTVEDKVLITKPGPRTNPESPPRPTNTPTLEQLLTSHNNASAVSNANVTSPILNSSSAPRSFGQIHPDALIVDANPPPPAYSSLPTSLQALPFPTSPRNNGIYSTFEQLPLEDHLEQGFLPYREPENMGRPEEDPNEATPLARFQVRKGSRCRSIASKILFVALVLAVLSSVLTALLNWNHPPPKLGGPGRRYCSSATYHKDPILYTFPVGSDLSVVQKTRKEDDGARGYSRVDTAGEVRIRHLPKGSKHGDGQGHASVVINVSHPDIQVEWTLEQDSRFLTITTPLHANLDPASYHCVSLDIVVWLPEDATLSSLLVSSISLGLTVLDDIKVDVSGGSRLESISGHISFPTPSSAHTPNIPISHPEFRFDSRRVDVKTISGDINGLFPLLDYLGPSSKSGNIDVSVLPHEALPSDPAPADLDIHTISGDIEVRLPLLSTTEPKSTPPLRDYITKVVSTSGHISGAYYLGSSGQFQTVSGYVRMKILPVVQSGSSDDPDSDPKSEFKTTTTSGPIEVEILNPMFIAPEQLEKQDALVGHGPIGNSKSMKLRNLQSSHTTKSSNIVIHCPDAWEGTVSGKTVSGKTVSGYISAKGKGLEMIKNKKGFINKEVLARKGVDSGDAVSFTAIEALSGNIRFIVGSN